MRKLLLMLPPLVSLATLPLSAAESAYPAALRGDHVDVYHGNKIADPYRWLEDLDSPETAAWVEAQNKLTFGFLEKLPARTAFRERLTKLWNYPQIGRAHV